jgi:hypothetical protein
VAPTGIAFTWACTSGRATIVITRHLACNSSGCYATSSSDPLGCENMGVPNGSLDPSITGPDPQTGCYTFLSGDNCTVEASLIRGPNGCCPGPTGPGPLVFCPC